MAQERRQKCVEPNCGHRRSHHLDEVVNHPCTECTCPGFMVPVPVGLIPPPRTAQESELVQLRAKVQVYETRFEEKDRTISQLRADMNTATGTIKAQELALEVSNKVIEELKTELGGTRFLVSMMVDTGALPESFAKTFMPTMPMVGEDDEHGYFEGETGPVAVAIILDEDPDYRS